MESQPINPIHSAQNIDSAKLMQIQKSIETKLRWLEDIQQMEQTLSPGSSNEEEMMKTVMLSLMGNFGCSSAHLFLFDGRKLKARCIKRYGSDYESITFLQERIEKSQLLRDLKKAGTIISLTSLSPDDPLSQLCQKKFLLMVLLPIEKNYCGIIFLGERLSREQFLPEELSLISIMATNITAAIRNYRLTNQSFQLKAEVFRTRGLLEQFVAPEIVDGMLNSNSEVHTKGEKKKIAVLTADIRGFTAISESVEPELMVTALNRFYSAMSDVVFHHKGMVDKFIGDAVMAVFGTPISMEDDSERAVKASLDMHKFFDRLISEDEEFASVFGNTGMGIAVSTGEAIVGNLGSGKRMDYTVIGKSVNLSSRLCGVARSKELLIDSDTFAKVKGNYRIEELKPLALKGIGDFVQVFKVIS